MKYDMLKKEFEKKKRIWNDTQRKHYTTSEP